MSRYMTKRRKIAIRNKCCAIVFCLFFTAGTALSTIFYQTNNQITIPTVEIPEVSDEVPLLEFKPLLSVVEPPEIKEKAVIKDSYDVPNGIEEVYDHIVNVTGNKGLISEYVRSKDWNDEHALLIFNCESGLIADKFNPETNSKLKGLTKYSSCGVAQINSPLCVGIDGKCANNPLCDYKYNIDVAYEMWTRRGWQPWINCSAKYNISWY